MVSSRVSVPSISRLIGSARPPRPSPLRAGPHGLINGVASRLSFTILSCSCHSRSESFRRYHLSGPLQPSLRSTFACDDSRKSHRTRARLYLCSSKNTSSSSRDSDASFLASQLRSPRSRSLSQARQDHSASGPSDACQSTLTRLSVRPCGLTPTGRACLLRLDSCRGSASPISCWIVHGHPSFRGFSPFAAA